MEVLSGGLAVIASRTVMVVFVVSPSRARHVFAIGVALFDRALARLFLRDIVLLRVGSPPQTKEEQLTVGSAHAAAGSAKIDHRMLLELISLVGRLTLSVSVSSGLLWMRRRPLLY